MPFGIDRSSIRKSLRNEVAFPILPSVQCPCWPRETSGFTGMLLLLYSRCDHGANLTELSRMTSLPKFG